MGLAILCPGQGAQHAAMFDLALAHPVAHEALRAASQSARRDLVGLTKSGVDIFINSSAQPLICAAEFATWTALAQLLPAPTVFAGYSVGELAAYACAGALSVGELTRLAHWRATLMDSACGTPTGMIALRGLNEHDTRQLCAQHGLAIAIVNGEDHFILGGPRTAIAALEAHTNHRGAKMSKLPVAIAAHTPWLAPAREGLRGALRASGLLAPRIAVLAGINARAITTRDDAIETLAAQLCTTVRWSACLDEALARGCDVFLELGPGNALARMTRERFSDVAVHSVADFRSFEGVAEWVDKNI